MTSKETLSNRLARVALVLAILSQSGLAASAAGPVNETAMAKAYALYQQQKYAASAEAFEALIASSSPNARLYYYAALANRANNRIVRAKQLCQYVIANFPGTTEATYAQKLYPDAAPKTANSADALPDDLKGKNSLQEDHQQSSEPRVPKLLLRNPLTTPIGRQDTICMNRAAPKKD